MIIWYCHKSFWFISGAIYIGAESRSYVLEERKFPQRSNYIGPAGLRAYPIAVLREIEKWLQKKEVKKGVSKL